MARILVTRAAPEADATAARLRALGHNAVISPVLEIDPVSAKINVSGVQALLFTSAAAARAVAYDRTLKALPVLAIGDATAKAAQAVDFTNVHSAGGADLVDVAKAAWKPEGGAILHLSGEDVAGDLAGDLAKAGFETRRTIVYRARFAAMLTAEASDYFKAGMIDAVLFHSARGGESFARLAGAAGVTHALSSVDALCFSDRVAESVKSLSWRAILVASAPREEALLSLITPAAGERT